MFNKTILAVAAACSLFFGATMANAEDASWHASLGVGSTEVEQTNGWTPSSQGSSLDLSLGHDIVTIGDIDIGLEAGVRYSRGEGSERQQVCDVPSCGYDEYGTWTTSSPWSGKLGVYAEHPLGPVDISAALGVQVNQVVQESSYDSGGKVTYTSRDTDFAVGPYWRLGASYAFTDTWSVGVSYEHADLTRSKWSGTFGGGSDELDANTWTLRVINQF